MRYPVAIEPGDKTHAVGIVFPDLPGCFSAGDTLEDALANAEEAALLWLEDSLEQGEAPPSPRDLRSLVTDPQYRGWAFAVVPVDLSRIEGPSLRINITVAQRALEEIDAAAQQQGTSRSGFLVAAALDQARKLSPMVREGKGGYVVRKPAAKRGVPKRGPAAAGPRVAEASRVSAKGAATRRAGAVKRGTRKGS